MRVVFIRFHHPLIKTRTDNQRMVAKRCVGTEASEMGSNSPSISAARGYGKMLLHFAIK